MRLDFQLETQSIEEFSQEEYEYNYYWELRVLGFLQTAPSKNQLNNIPKEFLLQISLGLSFEPYKNVKEQYLEVYLGLINS